MRMYVLLLVGFPAGLLGLDIVLAYVSVWKARAQLMDRLKPGSLTDEQVKLLAGDIAQAPPGIPGLARGTIAVALILIIGIAVFHLVVFAPSGTDMQGVDRILTLLTGALTSITGFYFGSKATQEAHANADSAAQPDAGSQANQATAGGLALNPAQAQVGDVVEIKGSGFGASRGAITFGSTQAAVDDILAWTDAVIRVKVPANARSGQMNIIVSLADGHQLSSPPTAFTVIGSRSPTAGALDHATA